MKTAYHSLEDYLRSHTLDVDGILDDGFGAPFAVKGRIIDAVVLFVDMASFSSHSMKLSPVETLILANNFFTWISAEGLRGRPGIVDKYIGDELMVIFSKDFGSEDPLKDAIRAGQCMAERDPLGFDPHIGIAAGQVVIGYVGTTLGYNCSAYGRPVTIAQRCCQIRSEGVWQASIVIPASAWSGQKLDEILTKRRLQGPDGQPVELELPWKLMPSRKEQIKGEELEILEIRKDAEYVLHPQTLEERANEAFEGLKQDGCYNPKRLASEPIPMGLVPTVETKVKGAE